MRDLDFGGIKVAYTTANLILWWLHEQPGQWVPVCKMLRCKQTAGMNRLARAAEAIRKTDPLLGATLRDVRWRGEWAMLSTTYHKM